MFTGAAVTAVASFLGGDLLMLLAGRLAPAPAVSAAKALFKVMKVIEANAEHLPPGVVRQIADEAKAAGNGAHASVYTGMIRNGWGN